MDYAHARHAGNAGDVFKHVALIALCEELLRQPEPLLYFETHAGDGLYALGSVGEWGEGVQRIWQSTAGLVGRYAQLVRKYSAPDAARPAAVPGSPLIAASLLREQDRMILHEIDPQAATALRRAVGCSALRAPPVAGEAGSSVPQAEVRETDGLAALPPSGRALVLIDPPYAQKQEWTDAARAAARLKGVPFALWYPIKALTRPRALLQELGKLGVHGTAVELHWTPLRLKRDRLNGSGMILAHVPRAALAALGAALPELGALLQTHGEWSSVMVGF